MTFEELAEQYCNLANRANQLEHLVGKISKLLMDDMTQATEWVDPRKAVIVELSEALKKWLEACEEDDFEPLRAESEAALAKAEGQS